MGLSEKTAANDGGHRRSAFDQHAGAELNLTPGSVKGADTVQLTATSTSFKFGTHQRVAAWVSPKGAVGIALAGYIAVTSSALITCTWTARLSPTVHPSARVHQRVQRLGRRAVSTIRNQYRRLK